MLRKALLSIVLSTFIAALGIGQADMRALLQEMLLTQEELSEVLGANWFLQSIDQPNPEPEGATTAVAIYLEEKREIPLTIGLLNFEDPGLALGFREEALNNEKFVTAVENIFPDNPELLEELGAQSLLELNEGDTLDLLTLRGGAEQMLLLHRRTLIAFIRAPVLSLEELIAVMEHQLQKVFTICGEVGAELAFCKQ